MRMPIHKMHHCGLMLTSFHGALILSCHAGDAATCPAARLTRVVVVVGKFRDLHQPCAEQISAPTSLVLGQHLQGQLQAFHSCLLLLPRLCMTLDMVAGPMTSW
jgi:hypothetical protein